MSVLAGAVALSLSGCDRPPAAESLVEWSPSDHHSIDEPSGAARARAAPEGTSAPGPGEEGSGVQDLVEVTWRQQCSSCHGLDGRGDGQLGPMVGASDLTRGDWQARTTDAQIIAVIRNGRNRMPHFDLPEPVLAGLVKRIRSLREP